MRKGAPGAPKGAQERSNGAPREPKGTPKEPKCIPVGPKGTPEGAKGSPSTAKYKKAPINCPSGHYIEVLSQMLTKQNKLFMIHFPNSKIHVENIQERNFPRIEKQCNNIAVGALICIDRVGGGTWWHIGRI